MPRMVLGKRPTGKTALRRMLWKTYDKRLSIRIRIVLITQKVPPTFLIGATHLLGLFGHFAKAHLCLFALRSTTGAADDSYSVRLRALS